MRRMSRGSAAGGSAEQVLGLLGNLHAQKEALQREKTPLVEDNISLQDQNELLMRQLQDLAEQDRARELAGMMEGAQLGPDDDAEVRGHSRRRQLQVCVQGRR